MSDLLNLAPDRLDNSIEMTPGRRNCLYMLRNFLYEMDKFLLTLANTPLEPGAREYRSRMRFSHGRAMQALIGFCAE